MLIGFLKANQILGTYHAHGERDVYTEELTLLQLKCCLEEEWTSGIGENWSSKTVNIKSSSILQDLGETAMKMFAARRAGLFV